MLSIYAEVLDDSIVNGDIGASQRKEVRATGS